MGTYYFDISGACPDVRTYQPPTDLCDMIHESMANKETNPETEGSPLKVSLNHLRERFFPKKTPVTLPDSSLKAGLGPIYSDARIYTFRDKHGKETHVFGRLEDIQN